MKNTKQELAAVTMTAAAAKAKWLKENLHDGEIYAGLMLGEAGEPDHHLIVMAGEATSVTWDKAKEWAASIGGFLPTRREQRVLFANAKAAFQPTWYWSSEEYAPGSGYAWAQGFGNGSQNGDDKDYSGRARAVRRLIIQ